MNIDVSERRGRGRPRQFDEDDVLDALVQLFWERGFEAASLNDIVAAAELNRSSLYKTFGTKDQVFFAAIDRYLADRLAALDETLGRERGLENVGEFLETLRTRFTTDGGSRGCLAVNTLTELGMRDERVAAVANRYRHQLSSGLQRPLERAAARGEIDRGLIEAYVDMLVAFCVSLAVTARSGATPDELERQIDSMKRLVDSWRLASFRADSTST
jgi:TetR/AcrR family transcriptional repressor of nem operon